MYSEVLYELEIKELNNKFDGLIEDIKSAPQYKFNEGYIKSDKEHQELAERWCNFIYSGLNDHIDFQKVNGIQSYHFNSNLLSYDEAPELYFDEDTVINIFISNVLPCMVLTSDYPIDFDSHYINGYIRGIATNSYLKKNGLLK